MVTPGRSFSAGSKYRYGFNGKENDKDINAGAQDYGMRINDVRIGKFLSIDPLTSKYPMLTPYQFASNRPIDGIDLDGGEYARYKLTVDYQTGHILSSEIIWHNTKQHNEYGDKGQGILYEVSVWDSWFKTYRSTDVKTMVYRNASTLLGVISTEYGNYMGATGLKIVGANGNFTDDDDYSVNPVDQVDNLARAHDIGYDNLKAKGANSLFNDWGTTPVDERALKGWDNFQANYEVGAADPYNNQAVTSSERAAAWRASTLFNDVVEGKKADISTYIMINFSSLSYKIKDLSNKNRPSHAENVEATEFNYQIFLNLYMNKDKNGVWTRKPDKWTKSDKGDWTPNKPKK